MLMQKSLHYCHQHLEPRKITFARESLGLTRKELADRIDKSSSAVTQYESGTINMSFDVFQTLVQALHVRPEFLTQEAPPLPPLGMDACHFRANKRLSQMERVRKKCYAQQICTLYRYAEDHEIAFPEQTFSPYEGEDLAERDMDDYAAQVRGELGLGPGPIPDMAMLLESIGIRIVLLPDHRDGLDAFSSWIDGRPFIMISSQSPASRMQFDYAHEFAHLLLDENTVPGDPLAERRAHRFASAFLMPRRSFVPDCPRIYRRSAFISVKNYWHVSIGAALYRARELGIMAERIYRNALIAQSRAGERKEEPGEFDPPLPLLFSQAMELLSEEIDLSEMANALALSEAQLEQFLRDQLVSEQVINKMKPAMQQRRARIVPFSPTVL